MRTSFRANITSQWDERARVAMDRGDIDGYRLASVNARVALTMATGEDEEWGSWKTRAVCRYVTKVFERMTTAELSGIGTNEVEELIQHAAEGLDRWAAKRELSGRGKPQP